MGCKEVQSWLPASGHREHRRSVRDSPETHRENLIEIEPQLNSIGGLWRTGLGSAPFEPVAVNLSHADSNLPLVWGRGAPQTTGKLREETHAERSVGSVKRTLALWRVCRVLSQHNKMRRGTRVAKAGAPVIGFEAMHITSLHHVQSYWPSLAHPLRACKLFAYSR